MSPSKIRKLPGKQQFRVSHNGKVSAKSTTKKKAQAQTRLLRGISHGMKPRER